MSGFDLPSFVLAGAAVLAAAGSSIAQPYAIVSGRWDNTVAVVDIAKAVDPANDGTAKAIISWVRVTPDVDAKGTGVADTPAGGQPVSVAIHPGGKFAYVVNHSGRATPDAAKAFQHGHPGTATVIDIAKALDPSHNGTTGAIATLIDTGGFGPVAPAFTPDGRHGFVSHAENEGNEDGGNSIAIVDTATHKVVGKIVQAYGTPGFPCPTNPVPHTSPDPRMGCFPGANGLAVSPLRGGILFAGNGGTNDVSVIDITRALAGDAGAEIARIPVQTGPFGIAMSPDGRLLATANRENMQTGIEGNTVSLIDVEKAAAGGQGAEVARVRIGTDDPKTSTRPFGVAFTPDGQRIVASNFRTNNVSVLDVRKALAGEPAEIARVAFSTPTGVPSRPRGIAITADGRHALITGAPRARPGSSVLFVLDLTKLEVVSRVTEVGDEAYFLDILQR